MVDELEVKVLQTIVEGLVQNPEMVKIERKVSLMGVLLNIDVAPEDRGLIIGRRGAMIDAIRFVIVAIGRKQRANILVKILEEDDRPSKPEKKSLLDFPF